jgi:hypothetical protein
MRRGCRRRLLSPHFWKENIKIVPYGYIVREISHAMCFVILVRLVSLMQVRSTLHVVRATSTKFGLPVGHTKFNRRNGKWMRKHIIVCVCVCVCVCVILLCIFYTTCAIKFRGSTVTHNTTIHSIGRHVSAYSKPSSGLTFSRTINKIVYCNREWKKNTKKSFQVYNLKHWSV